MDGFYRAALAEGFARRGPDLSPVERFEISATVPVVIGDDIERAADVVRPFVALYVGGMGTSTANFHREMIERLGYVRECEVVADLFTQGRRAEAAAAVPTALVQGIALIGPMGAVRDRLAAWQDTVVTSILVQGDAAALRAVADLLG